MEIDMNKMDVEKSVIISIPDEPMQSIGTICLICGEFVPLDSPYDCGYKICDKCKRAILRMRENMEKEEL